MNTRIVTINAKITEDGYVYLQAPPDSPDVIGLNHQLIANDPVAKIIKSVVAINDEARGKGPKPAK